MSNAVSTVAHANDARILIIAHGHPDQSKGGAEVAAYNLFKEYERVGIDTLFLARTGDMAHGGSVFSTRNSDREVLFHTSMGDWFNLRSSDHEHLTRHFAAFLKRYNPTVVHFHHYAHMGIEIIQVTRQALPDSKIHFTLHEYMAICSNNGQMVKRGSKKLCYEANPSDCAKCFPERSPADFFMRKMYLQSVFNDVDHFISPSEFLKQRYLEWGLPESNFSVIENGQPLPDNSIDAKSDSGSKVRGRFAFFGQINPFKGIDVILNAFSLLPDEVKKLVHLDIHGANLHLQEESFQKRVKELLDDLEGVVTMHGPYEPREMGALLEQCDWMIIPSIWWENSPMVIQEAYNYGRPIICSDIGGMAEKITDGVTGFHFRVGNAQSLAKVIGKCLDSGVWSEINANISRPLSINECALKHLELI